MHKSADRGGPSTSLPLVSVVVPFRDNRATISRSLAALASSTYSPLEIILVDDASTDGSVELAGEFMERLHSPPCALIRRGKRLRSAGARNAGALEAQGTFLFFTDADVVTSPDTIKRLVERLREDPELAAVFGSYEPRSGPQNFFSRYKNLVHHYTHQTASPEARTFWSGCGLIRRSAFLRLGGFNPRMHYVTDIDLGYRLAARGYRLFLDRDIQVTHLKRYGFRGLLHSDILCRAVPWTRVMLARGALHGHLNVRPGNVLSGFACGATVLFLSAAVLDSTAGTFLLASAAGTAGAYLVGNRDLLAMARRQGGGRFAMGVAAMHFLYYLYASVGFAIGLAAHAVDRLRGSRSPLAGAEVSGGGSGAAEIAAGGWRRPAVRLPVPGERSRNER